MPGSTCNALYRGPAEPAGPRFLLFAGAYARAYNIKSMICAKCSNKNRVSSNFCRFCGSSLRVLENSSFAPPTTPSTSNLKRIENILSNAKTKLAHAFNQASTQFKSKLLKNDINQRLTKRQKITAAVIAVFLVFVVAPRAKSYFDVNAKIKEVMELQKTEKFEEALNILDGLNNRWTFNSIKTKIIRLKENQQRYKEDFVKLEEIEAKRNNGQFDKARELLNTVSADYPVSERVYTLKSEIQANIEDTLRGQVAAAATAKEAAEARARVEAKARSDAAASAAAAAARDAEIERQREEAERLRQVRISFYNQLWTLYNAVNGDGLDYYNQAMSYYNSGSELTAISIFGQAKAIFLKAYNDTISMMNSFSGMPSNYVTAAENMKRSAYNCYLAADAMMDIIAGTSYGTALNTYAGNCDSYKGNARLFLDTTTP